MTPEEHREMFTNALYLWLELNGVTFASPVGAPPFQVTVDLNKLKIGMAELIRAFGGDFQ